MRKIVTFLWFNDQAKEAVDLYLSLFENGRIVNTSYLWETLSEGGEILSCGWLKDRFGLSWQIMPESLDIMMRDPDTAKADRVAAAMLRMEGKLNLSELEKAYKGE
jgi:predicted 3-demethylubiquinone-9 3-methyltransferase (glyoxalase superfamily)